MMLELNTTISVVIINGTHSFSGYITNNPAMYRFSLGLPKSRSWNMVTQASDVLEATPVVGSEEELGSAG